MSRSSQQWVVHAALIFVALIVLQLPFLHADADYGLGFSRGPFTDEGLYSAQVRNALITGHLDVTETDGVLKNPLFSLVTWVVLKLFGDSMTTLRAAVAVTCSATLALIAAQTGAFPRVLRLAIPIGILSYFPFHYGHLALAEMPSTVAIVAAMFVVQRRLEGAGVWTLAVSGLLVFVSYALKVQFAYAAAIAPVAFIIAALLQWLSRIETGRRAAVDFFGSSAIALGFALLYVGVWIVPHWAIYSVVTSQVSANSSGTAALTHVIWANAKSIVHERGVWPLLLLMMVGAGIGCRQWLASTHEPERRLAWIASVAAPSAWLILELHKLMLSYLPSRYVVSLLIAGALWGAATACTDRLLLTRFKPVAARIKLTAIAVAIAINCGYYMKALLGRHYVIHETQQALAAQGIWRGRLAMGPWAPTLFWGTGAITKPIWHGHYNDRDILLRFSPAALVSEDDQEDSHQALALDGIVLPATPSMRLRVRDWSLGIYEWPPGSRAGATR